MDQTAGLDYERKSCLLITIWKIKIVFLAFLAVQYKNVVKKSNNESIRNKNSRIEKQAQ